MLIEMKVDSLAVAPCNKAPIILLKDTDNKETLPIWVGVLEAGAIAAILEGVSFERPMTHDLIKDLIDSSSSEVEKVTIDDLRENVYYATLHIRSNGTTIAVDSRPSDAIAIALRCNASIFVESSVIEKGSDINILDEDQALDDIPQEDNLEDFKDEAFGKYKM